MTQRARGVGPFRNITFDQLQQLHFSLLLTKHQKLKFDGHPTQLTATLLVATALVAVGRYFPVYAATRSALVGGMGLVHACDHYESRNSGESGDTVYGCLDRDEVGKDASK